MAIAAMLQPALAETGFENWGGEFGGGRAQQGLVHLQPDPTPDVERYTRDFDPSAEYGPETQRRFI